VPVESAGRVRAVQAGLAGVSWLEIGDHGRDAALTALTDAVAGLGLPDDVPISVRNDVEVAFAAAPDYTGDGLVLVAGTGSIVARLADGHVVSTVDGHGGLLDDAGSGLWIGRQCAQRALRALDGRGPWTALVPALTENLLGEAVTTPPVSTVSAELARGALVPKLINAGLAALAGLCPLVTAAARAGDAVAEAILDEAVDALTESLRVTRPKPGEALVTTGGLLGPDGPLLDRLAKRVAADGLRPVPVSDGTAGAIRLAWGLAGS
jgi:N-acetylglucosamine kinase-like BadF-type ATPase